MTRIVWLKTIPLLGLFAFVHSVYCQCVDFNSVSFKAADSTARVYKDKGLDNLPALAYNLTAHLNSDVERFRAIYKWVCISIGNDYGLYYKNKRKRSRFRDDSLKLKAWNTRFTKRLFNRLLTKRETICTGYAYLVSELAQLANIECAIVHGFGRTSTTDVEQFTDPNHSWNAVKLNEKWYLCDPTWASGLPNRETGLFEFNYNDGFFLADPKLFAVNHYPLEARWFLLDDAAPTFETFLEAPVLYGKAYLRLSFITSPLQMHHKIRKDESVAWDWVLQETVSPEAVSMLIDSGSTSTKLKPNEVTLDGKLLRFTKQFTTKGFYDVHVYIEDDLVATYTVKVTS